MTNIGDVFIATSIVPGVPSQEIIFRGIQLGFEEIPPLSIYDLTEGIAGHPKGSTVTGITLEEAGFVLPPEAP